MADLLISRQSPGVALVRSVDPFDNFEIHRIDRDHWQQTPERPGLYLLYGVSQGDLTVYIGMSQTNMRHRIRSHHLNPRRNWFGVLFAVPVSSPLLLPAIEAELIGELNEAGVVDVIANTAAEERHRNADDVHIEPAVGRIRDGLQLVLGSDIFVASDADEGPTDTPIPRMTPLAREYRGRAAEPRSRTADDPEDATHAYAGAAVVGWGRFEGDEPDKRFRVLSHTGWRRAQSNPEATTYYEQQVQLSETQDRLVTDGVLDAETMSFPADHVFESWTQASQVVSGNSQKPWH